MRDVSQPDRGSAQHGAGDQGDQLDLARRHLDRSPAVQPRRRRPRAQQDVQAKVARIRRTLPPDIDEPIIKHFDPNDSPIMSVAMQSDGAAASASSPTRRRSRDAAASRRFRASAASTSPAADAADPRAARPGRDARHTVFGPPQVIAALQRENQEVPAGRVDARRHRAARPRHRPHRRPAGVRRHRRRGAQRRAGSHSATSPTSSTARQTGAARRDR